MSFFLHITGDLVMHKLVEWEVIEFIRPGVTNNWILMCDLRQDFIEFVVLCKT